MPIIETKGAASSQGYGEFAKKSGVATYIEDVFSTWLYTGTGSAQTITNGIDLAGKGGLVWVKSRSGSYNNILLDTARGDYALISNLTSGQSTFDWTPGSSGYSNVTNSVAIDGSGTTYASWTFRKQPKFFDVVTYTGNDTGQSIPHNLGSVPGCMIIKATNSVKDWYVYHREVDTTAPEDYYTVLNNASARVFNGSLWDAPTSTHIVLNTAGGVNQSGVTYVAYLFAHNAGGFGASGTDNVISCGSYTGTGAAGNNITLGYEPQWLMIKNTSTGSTNWVMFDNMRGMPVSDTTARLNANTAEVEVASTLVIPTATGFNPTGSGTFTNSSGHKFIYIAIRRPMKTPTTGTSVYSPTTWSGNTTTLSTDRSITGQGFPTDLVIVEDRSGNNGSGIFLDRLRGASQRLFSYNTNAETATQEAYSLAQQEGILLGDYDYNYTGRTYVGQFLRRAPGFFDVVCYKTTLQTDTTVYHNLGVVPELAFIKPRNSAGLWRACVNNTGTLILNTTDPLSSTQRFVSATSTQFTAMAGGTYSLAETNTDWVAYLFASCPGVSKVGTYTGNGSSQTINCGFTGGARFVLIKRTDSTGNWFVWDTARGMVAGNDPYLALNTTAAEVTTNDSVDTDNSGFIVNQVTATNVNVNGASYIYLAIA